MSAAGIWNVVMKTPVGDKTVSFSFTVEGAALKGTMTDETGTSEVSAGSVEGSELKWSGKVKKPMPMTMTFTGTIEGDTIAGGAKSPFGTVKFTGERA